MMTKNHGNQRVGGVLRAISTPESLPPKPRTTGNHRRTKSGSENVPPADLNVQVELFSSPSPASGKAVMKTRSPLPPRPPSNPVNLLKRKMNVESATNKDAVISSDSGVQVVVRMRPLNKDEEEGEQIAHKISSNSLSVLDQTFTFDSVAGTDSTQDDVFQLVGLPLVENCLAGFNSSIFAYGQTGSGKTYTMWGPANVLSEDDSTKSYLGITARVIDQLFLRIQEEQAKHSDRQLNYQCRCSFLEIYNEQITDLLEPSLKNLQIREDVKSGVYVENLTEEYVNSMKDLIQLLVKGLANRRIGATSINSESSRSHSVFTCVVESRCKNMADGLSNLRTSRINLVDLAGSERQKLTAHARWGNGRLIPTRGVTGAAGERLKEAGNINRSLSQLGNLINILAEVSQSGKQRHIPYRDSRLTFLLQESLGGNAKLAMICAISPAQSCKNETLSTLRFARRAKAIQNKAVVNEVTENDVNVLREQIRQLKDELIRMKSNGSSNGECNGGYSTGWNVRRSLNLLRMSLKGASIVSLHMEDDCDEEMVIVEEGIEEIESSLQIVSYGKDGKSLQSSTDLLSLPVEEADVKMEGCQPDDTKGSSIHNSALLVNDSSGEHPEGGRAASNLIEISSRCSLRDEPGNSLSIVCCPTPVHSPTLSLSPTLDSFSWKGLRMSAKSFPSQHSNINPEALKLSVPLTMVKTPSTQITANPHMPTESITSSLNRGLQVTENQPNSPLRSSFPFPCKALDCKPFQPLETNDAAVQTVPEARENFGNLSEFVCGHCKRSALNNEDAESMDSPLVLVDASHLSDPPAVQVPKHAFEKVLAGAIRREMALEEFCSKQAAEIMQLNRLIQQYKHERECNAIIEQIREEKICRLEGLMDGVLPTKEFMQQEFVSLTDEHKLLKNKYESHPELLTMRIQLKRVQDELDQYRVFYELGEREVLMEELHHLRNQLRGYLDKSLILSQKWSSPPELTHTDEIVMESTQKFPIGDAEKRFEQERQKWTEAESEWISLAEDLRSELEASRSLSEKRKMELNAEKKCSDELKEALQTAMQGHARILEQYADLQEKHIALLARHRKMRDGITDVRRAAAKADVKSVESRFVDALDAEISALKAEREKERRFWRYQNNGLQSQLRDTAEAVQAAGELLVRLKESEEVVSDAKARALRAEKRVEKVHSEMDKLKKNHEKEIVSIKQFFAQTKLPKEAVRPPQHSDVSVKFDEGQGLDDHQCWTEEFAPFYREDNNELARNTGLSSFAGYDRCNI